MVTLRVMIFGISYRGLILNYRKLYLREKQPMKQLLKVIQTLTAAMAAITRPAAPANLKGVKIALVWYMSGLLLFFSSADWSVTGWTAGYWIWTMIKDTLFLYAALTAIPNLRNTVYPIFFYSIIRSVWEIIAQTLNKDINDSMVLDYMFYIILTITVYNLAKNIVNQWKK